MRSKLEKTGSRGWEKGVLGLLLAAMLVPAPLLASEASTAYAKGRDMEAKQDYEAAYAFYARAYQLKPKNLDYRVAATRIRTFAGLQHVHRGQQLVTQGKLQEGLLEFKAGADIDPSSYVAQQEMRRTQVMIDEAQAKGGAEGSNAARAAEEGPVDGARGPVRLAAMTDTPVSLRMNQEAKVLYTTLCKVAGINVIFDPDYKGEHVNVDLNDVSLMEALEILGMQTKTFWRPITPNTIYVAADTTGKRKEIEQNVMKTVYLNNISETTEIQDMISTLRTELDVTKIAPIPGQQALVIRGTPDQVALAEKLVHDMDKARPEVVVEVAIMQVSRSKARDLGVQPPTSTTISLVGTGSSTSTSTTGTTTTGTSSTTTSSGTMTLNDFSHLNATNFAVTVPSVSAKALFSDSHSRLLQNPQLRTMDGQKATLKIGERVPVATGSFAGVGGGSVSALVNTQFQYLDVGVNVDITPRVHANSDVTLKVSLDVSAVDSTTDIGGISQPVIGQHKLEQEIRLKEGEVNVIGGMLDDTDQKSLSGLPLLSSIPVLRYLFSSEHVDKSQSEIVFVLTPRVVRARQVDDENLRTLDVGTANTLGLHRSNAPAIKLASLTPAPPRDLRPQAQLRPVAPVDLSFSPAQTTAVAGNTFTVDVLINSAADLFSAPLEIQYDATRLQLLDASLGSFLKQDGKTVALARRDDPAGGIAWLSADRPVNAAGMSGSGAIFHLTFIAKTEGKAEIRMTHAGFKNAAGQDIPANGAQAEVEVRGKPS